MLRVEGEPFVDDDGFTYQTYRNPKPDVPFGRRPMTEAERLHGFRLQELQDDTAPRAYKDLKYRPERYRTWGGPMGDAEARDYALKAELQRAREAAVFAGDQKRKVAQGGAIPAGQARLFETAHPLHMLLTKVQDEHADEIRAEIIAAGTWSGSDNDRERIEHKVIECKEDLTRWLQNRALADGTDFDLERATVRWFERTRKVGQFRVGSAAIDPDIDSRPRDALVVNAKSDLTKRRLPDYIEQQMHELERAREARSVTAKRDHTKFRATAALGDEETRARGPKVIEEAKRHDQASGTNALQAFWSDVVDTARRVIHVGRLDSVFGARAPIGVDHQERANDAKAFDEARRQGQRKYAFDVNDGVAEHHRDHGEQLLHVEPVRTDDQAPRSMLADGDWATYPQLRNVTTRTTDQHRQPRTGLF